MVVRDAVRARRRPLARLHHRRVRHPRVRRPQARRPQAPPEGEARQPPPVPVPVRPHNQQFLVEEAAGAAPLRHQAFRARLLAAPAEDLGGRPASCM